MCFQINSSSTQYIKVYIYIYMDDFMISFGAQYKKGMYTPGEGNSFLTAAEKTVRGRRRFNGENQYHHGTRRAGLEFLLLSQG